MIVHVNNHNVLHDALDLANKQFSDNLAFRYNPQRIGPDLQGRTKFRFTLTVRATHGPHNVTLPGVRLSASGFHRTRRVSAACWHAYGVFFDYVLALDSQAQIDVGRRKITPADGNWTDWQIGSAFNPMMYSEACVCDPDTAHQPEHFLTRNIHGVLA